MKLLREINQQISNLTDAQKTVLAMAQFSATPKQAFASTTGSDKLVYARDSLARLGYINLSNGEVSITPAGQNAIIQYNLADPSGQPTQEATVLMNNAKNDSENTQTVNQQQSDF